MRGAPERRPCIACAATELLASERSASVARVASERGPGGAGWGTPDTVRPSCPPKGGPATLARPLSVFAIVSRPVKGPFDSPRPCACVSGGGSGRGLRVMLGLGRSGQIWPDVSHGWEASHRIRPDSAQLCPVRPILGPISDRSGRFGLDSTKFWRFRPSLARWTSLAGL